MRNARRCRRHLTVASVIAAAVMTGFGFTVGARAEPPSHGTERAARVPDGDVRARLLESARSESARVRAGRASDPEARTTRITASPEVTRTGARFAITGLSATTNINLAKASEGEPRAESWINITGMLTAPRDVAAICPWRMEIISALDEGERQLVKERPRDRGDEPRARRHQMVQCFMQSVLYNSRSDLAMQETLRGLDGLPARLMRVTGHADAVVAAKVVSRPVELKVMDEPVELVPGLTLLITEADTDERRAVVGFEVRTRRFRAGVAEEAGGKGGTPGLEPVFLGIVLRDGSGNVMQVLRDGQEVETRDEYLVVARHQGLSKEYLSRARSVEAVAVDGLENVRLAFEITDVGFGRSE